MKFLSEPLISSIVWLPNFTQEIFGQWAIRNNWFRINLRYEGGNSTTAEEVSRSQFLFPYPNWLVWKGDQKLAPIPMGI